MEARLRLVDEAVFLWSKIGTLPPPNPSDLRNLQEWMRRPSMGNVRLIGNDRNVWVDGKDLIAVRSRSSDNKVFRLLADTFTPLYHHIFGRYHKVRHLNPNLVSRANYRTET
jgi:hypothetical protein